MKLTIFAATGGIGRHLVGQALAAGHDVTAVARNPASLPAEVRAVRADLAIAQPATLATTVGGALSAVWLVPSPLPRLRTLPREPIEAEPVATARVPAEGGP